jgi:hypothetical protein
MEQNGVRYQKPERPAGCFAFFVPDPLFLTNEETGNPPQPAHSQYAFCARTKCQSLTNIPDVPFLETWRPGWAASP